MRGINQNKFFNVFLTLLMVLSLVLPAAAPVSAAKNDAFKTDRQSESVMQQKQAIAEQLKLSAKGPRLHKSLEGLEGSQEVDVIIHLSEKPVALEKAMTEVSGKTFTASNQKSTKAKIASQHGMMKRAMNANKISFKEGFSYDTVLNGVAATVKADDLEKILEIDGVTLVELDAEVYAYEDNSATEGSQIDLAMATSNSFLGIEPLWAEGYEGQGIKVAVLDTGIDADHPDFEGIYKGGKNFIPNSSTYAKERTVDDASETLPSERPAGAPEFNANGSSFYTSHGTHVAGTIAAIGNNEFGIKGIAPKVDLYAYRVLGAYGSGSTSGIIAAIEEAVNQEMDVINLSLGGGSNTETDAGSYAINNAMLSGVISVVATGNSGPNRGTMGTPSTAPFGIAVGNTTNPEELFDINVSVEAGDYAYSEQLNLMATTFGKNLEEQLAGEFELVAVPGIGTVSDFDGIDVDGKVALIARGEIAFVEKIENARANGAVATIIHNSHNGSNTPDISDVFLGDDFAFLPTVDMSYTDGEAIRAALASENGTVTFTNANVTVTDGDDVNDSSSRGPSVPNFDIKPDVSAPGTNIMSTIPMYKADFPDANYDEAFARKTGTSMATPHIAGIAALVQQANPDWNAFDVKVALSNTAKILDTEKYDVFAQGAGRVDAYAAVHASVLAYGVDQALPDAESEQVENLKGTVTFGPQSLEEDLTVTKEILVKDLKNVGGDYDVSVDVTKAFADAAVTVDKSSFTLDGEEVLTVTLTASQNLDVNPGDEILGYIHLNGTNSNLSLPFAADFGGAAKAEIKNMSISETDLSFDNDGYKDSATLNFTITGDVGTNYIELWDIMNPDGGEYGDGYIGYLHASASLGAGSYTLNVGGQYQPWSGDPATIIPDGLYTIDYTAQTTAGVIGDYVGPIVVKSSAGSIDSAVEGTTVTGTIVDKYVDYQAELVNYGLGFDINTKLDATSEVTIDGETVSSPITLAQDGSFSFDFSNEAAESVVVKYVDAAGNAAETVVVGDGEAPEEPETPEEPEEPEVPEDPVTRIENEDRNNRYTTAVELSKLGWDTSDVVVLARGDDFADALAGVPLADKLDAPMLLTQSDTFTKETKEEIERLGAKTIYVLGGDIAITSKVDAQLSNDGYEVVRIEGTNREATAVEIAKLVLEGQPSNKAVVVDGYNYPDAVSVAAYAAKEGMPILLTHSNKLPEVTQKAIQEFGITETIIIGGEVAISNDVATLLPGMTRVGGKDRIETSIEVAKYFNPDTNEFYVTTGYNFPDALAAGPLAAKEGTGVILVHKNVEDYQAKYFEEKDVVKVYVVGGELAVSNELVNELYELLK